MNKLIVPIVLLTLSIISCNGINEKAKKTINKGGETVGKTASEFIEGVTEGVDKTMQCEISLSPQLLDDGITTGKYSVEDNPDGGHKNIFTIYLIFDKDFKGSIMAKAFDKDSLEVGRSKLEVEGKSGDAGYYDFVFDKRTYIVSKGKVTLELIK